MVRFLLKTLLFGLFGIGFLYTVLSSENGNADPFHLKLVGPHQQSLILGNSKAAQGLVPDVLDSVISDRKSYGFFNFSFAVWMSSFGSVYLESIKNKLDPNTKNGLFIIAVDPWSIMADKINPEDEELFPDRDLPLAHVNTNSTRPNIPYLLHWYPYPNYEILLRRWRPANEILHPNGWLEVRVPMDEKDQVWRLYEKQTQFNYERENNILSMTRLKYLSITIKFLKNHGNVFLVRIPSHSSIVKLEEEMIPGFNFLITELAQNHHVAYLDLSHWADEFIYTDGVHLHKSSSLRISNIVGSWIDKELEKTQNR